MLTVRCKAVEAAYLLVHRLRGAEDLDEPGRQFGIFGKLTRRFIKLSLDALKVFQPAVALFGAECGAQPFTQSRNRMVQPITKDFGFDDSFMRGLPPELRAH